MSLAGARLLARWRPAWQRRGPDQAAFTWHGRGLEEGSEEQAVQDLEPEALGELLPASGARGGNTEIAWRGHQNSGGARRGGPDCPDGRGPEAGGEGRTGLPPRLLRLPARAVPAG